MLVLPVRMLFSPGETLITCPIWVGGFSDPSDQFDWVLGVVPGSLPDEFINIPPDAAVTFVGYVCHGTVSECVQVIYGSRILEVFVGLSGPPFKKLKVAK